MLLLQFCDGIEVDEELCPPLLLASGSIWVLKRSGVWLQGDEFQLVPTRCWLVVLRGHSMSVW